MFSGKNVMDITNILDDVTELPKLADGRKTYRRLSLILTLGNFLLLLVFPVKKKKAQLGLLLQAVLSST